jgi:hypothetical protein
MRIIGSQLLIIIINYYSSAAGNGVICAKKPEIYVCFYVLKIAKICAKNAKICAKN